MHTTMSLPCSTDEERQFDPQANQALVPESSRLGRHMATPWLMAMMALDEARESVMALLEYQRLDPELYQQLLGSYVHVSAVHRTESGMRLQHAECHAYNQDRVPLQLAWREQGVMPRRWMMYVAQRPMAARWEPSTLESETGMTLLSGRVPWMPSKELLRMCLADPQLQVLDVLINSASHLARSCKFAVKDMREGVHAEAFARARTRQLMLRFQSGLGGRDPRTACGS